MFTEQYIEVAERTAEEAREAGVAEIRAKLPTGESAEYCMEPECGEPIPEARRRALPGVKYCIECQARRERRGDL